MKRLFFATVIFMMLQTLTGCRPGVPGKYIQPGKMEDILYDYHIAQAMAMDPAADTRKSDFNEQLYTKAVFKKYGITEAEFDSSMVYYLRHTERLHVIYENLAKRMGDDAIKLGASESDVNKYAVLSNRGDTANIWAGEESRVLMPAVPYNKITFRIEADTTFHQGDHFLFNFVTNFIFQDGIKDAVAGLVIRYANDSLATIINHIAVSDRFQLALGNDNDPKIKEISGFIFLSKGGSSLTTLKLMFLDHLQLVRLHKKPFDKYKKNDNSNNGNEVGATPANNQPQPARPVIDSSSPGRPHIEPHIEHIIKGPPLKSK